MKRTEGGVCRRAAASARMSARTVFDGERFVFNEGMDLSL
jgi:hypothetical protein